jgi:hypothetical protein
MGKSEYSVKRMFPVLMNGRPDRNGDLPVAWEGDLARWLGHVMAAGGFVFKPLSSDMVRCRNGIKECQNTGQFLYFKLSDKIEALE